MALLSTNLTGQLRQQFAGSSLVIWMSAATLWLFLMWAAFATLDQIVRAEGTFISSSRPQII